jgi:hypothetical protein
MDSDATALENALAVLGQQHGTRLDGPQHQTEAQMRRTLEAQLGLDELTADRMVKKLAQTGRLVYSGSVEAGTEPGTSTTGPVISMPLTQTADGGQSLRTTAAPGVLMGLETGVPTDRVSDQPTEADREATPAPITMGEREALEHDRTEGYWRIG